MYGKEFDGHLDSQLRHRRGERDLDITAKTIEEVVDTFEGVKEIGSDSDRGLKYGDI
jgi:hypothetical protein